MSRSQNDTEFSSFIRRNLAVVIFIGVAMVGLIMLVRSFSQTDDRPYTVQVGGEAADVNQNGNGIVSAEPYQVVGQVGQQFGQSPGPLKIAIVVGHRDSDSGAVCDDGLQELQINTDVAQQVLANLEAEGLPVTLFSEFDPRSNGFSSDLLISLHADSCTPLDQSFTGYKTTINGSPQSPLLQNCIEQNYARQTGLPVHPTTITEDMTNYHVFRSVSAEAPAILLEMGFMYNDREILTTGSAVVAQGITNGVLCFLQSQ